MFRAIRPPAQAGYHLTPHEIRLLQLLVAGHNYKTAAAKLGLSVNTVSFHVRKIYEKLQVHSKSQAVAKALKKVMVDGTYTAIINKWNLQASAASEITMNGEKLP